MNSFEHWFSVLAESEDAGLVEELRQRSQLLDPNNEDDLFTLMVFTSVIRSEHVLNEYMSEHGIDMDIVFVFPDGESVNVTKIMRDGVEEDNGLALGCLGASVELFAKTMALLKVEYQAHMQGTLLSMVLTGTLK